MFCLTFLLLFSSPFFLSPTQCILNILKLARSTLIEWDLFYCFSYGVSFCGCLLADLSLVTGFECRLLLMRLTRYLLSWLSVSLHHTVVSSKPLPVFFCFWLCHLRSRCLISEDDELLGIGKLHKTKLTKMLTKIPVGCVAIPTEIWDEVVTRLIVWGKQWNYRCCVSTWNEMRDTYIK